MRNKFIYIALVLMTVACEKSKLVRPFVPSDNGHLECVNLVDLGWIKKKESFAACDSHFRSPKFKLGSRLRIDNNKYTKGCVLQVTYLTWSPPKQIPIYVGNVLCPADDKKLSVIEKDVWLSGKELKL